MDMRKTFRMMNNDSATVNTQKGIIIRTLGNLITAWPMNVHQKKELIFQDLSPISSQCLKVGDWIQMEVEHGDTVVYHEKIAPVLPTLVTSHRSVQIKTRVYFPNGFSRNHEYLIGYSDDVGEVGAFFQCNEFKADFYYDVWITRPPKKLTSLARRCGVYWCIARQTLIPITLENNRTRLLWEDHLADDSSEYLNNTVTEGGCNPSEIDFSYVLNFNDSALRKFWDDPRVREAVYQCSSNFARSIEAYLSGTTH